MNRTLIVAAITTLVSGAALAQSSVTIYGRANVTIERQDADGTKTTREVNNASRIGFKGTEDLGGGLKAGFVLEHGWNIDTGTPSGAFWGRQSEVNLGSNAFGTLRLGNFTSEAYYATADYVSMHNHDTGTSSDALYAYVANNTNKIGYRAPEFVKGMSLEAGVTLGENTSPKTYDLAWNYAMGPLQLGAGYTKKDDGLGQVGADQFAIRALYELGAFTFGGYYQRDKNGIVAGAADIGNRNSFRLSGMYAFGASELHLNYGHAAKYSKVADSKADQYTVGYNYNLSKRTKVYTYYTAVNDSAAKLYGGDFNSLAVGVRHNF